MMGLLAIKQEPNNLIIPILLTLELEEEIKKAQHLIKITRTSPLMVRALMQWQTGILTMWKRLVQITRK